MEALAGFYKEHGLLARMRQEYPGARVVRDALPRNLVIAYRATFAEERLPENCHASILDKARSFYERARAVATDSKCIAWPRACAEANHVAAYATLKCEELYRQQSWQGSMLTPVQREHAEWPQSYPVKGMQDFAFWVKYGSWSCCPACGSYHFNDKYFREQVYQTQVGIATPDHMAPHRHETPSEPIVHAEGQV